MKLPRHELAVISREKLTGYLLSPTHPWGRHKAQFFTAIGFSDLRWEEFATALRQHAAEHDLTRTEPTPFGTRYVVEGIMEGPSKKTANVRTVWFFAEGNEAPHFVTAYPIRGVR